MKRARERSVAEVREETKRYGREILNHLQKRDFPQKKSSKTMVGGGS
jgi:hypothetical protein